MVGGSPEHWEGETSLGALGEVAEEGGSRADSCRKVLPICGPGGEYFWGGKWILMETMLQKLEGLHVGF